MWRHPGSVHGHLWWRLLRGVLALSDQDPREALNLHVSRCSSGFVLRVKVVHSSRGESTHAFTGIDEVKAYIGHLVYEQQVASGDAIVVSKRRVQEVFDAQ